METAINNPLIDHNQATTDGALRQNRQPPQKIFKLISPVDHSQGGCTTHH